MSLLLEALKKAERAKEEAQRRARSESEGNELRLEGVDATAADARPVLTRAELPDIKQPLEILSDDIRPTAQEPAPPREKPVAEPRLREQSSKPEQAQAADRASAKRVFEAKFKEPNPRLPFFIAMGFLGVFALGTVGYFWYQLRPPPPLVNANPKPPTGEVSVAAAAGPLPTAAAPAAPAAAGAIPGLPTALPGGPISAPAPASAPTPAPIATGSAARRPAPAASAPAVEAVPRARPAPKPAPRPTAIARAAAAPAAPRQSAAPTPEQTRAPQIHPKVEAGYAAYLAGDLVAARADYQEALREDASNRDALLGLAAIDVRGGRHEAAEATYLRLLQLNPADAHAQAGLIALRGARLDPLATESRVKSMLATDPGANVLHFTLGNQLAQQGRWGEAQQEYFKAFAANPDNADFAYNLAVSLDHLRQPKLALDYYRRAIALAGKRAASFDVTAARQRASQLGN